MLLKRVFSLFLDNIRIKIQSTIRIATSCSCLDNLDDIHFFKYQKQKQRVELLECRKFIWSFLLNECVICNHMCNGYS